MSDKKKLSRSVSLPVISRQASISSFDEEARTAEMVFATGHQVRRFDFLEGEFMEELSMEKKHVDVSRLKQGAVPFLKDHRRGIDQVLGIVEEARFDGEQGTAKVRFSEREEVQGLIKDIQSGILRNVSVGYRVKKFEKIGENEGVPVLRATDWEPLEVSSVAIGADPNAGFRAAREEDERTFECEVIGMEKETTVEPGKKNDQAGKEGLENQRGLTEDKPTGEKVMEKEIASAKSEGMKEGAKAEGERRDAIEKACRAAGLDSEAEKDMIKRGISADEARSEVIELLAKRDKETETRSQNSQVTIVRDQMDTAREGVSNAILHRANPGVENAKLSDVGRDWVGLSLLETVREYARLSGVKNVNRMNKSELAGLAFKRAGMHTSSDFPSILEDIIGKTLRMAYSASPQTFAPFTRRVQNPDFKDVSRAQLGLGSGLLEVPASGEVKEGTVSDGKEKYALKQYARKYSIDRKAIINDDLDAFGRLPAAMGVKARSLESDLVWGIITANAALSDGVALFHGTHGNLGSAGVPSATNVGLGRAAMRIQQDPDGEPLNLRPVYVAGPAALETTLEQLVSAFAPNETSKVNPFAPGGRTPLQAIIEPRLDADSTTAWYLFSMLEQVDMIELATLQGSQEPEVATEELFDSLGMKIRVVHDAAAKAIDYRGMFKDPGV